MPVARHFSAADDLDAGLVHFEVDDQAEPANVLPALAKLLIGIDRRRQEREAEASKQQGGNNAAP